MKRDDAQAAAAAWFSDEMRLGLRGQVRRVLAPRGVKVVQPLQLVYKWCYLILALEPLSGEIKWEWIERMNQEQIKPVLERWDLRCVVWDGAPQATEVKALRSFEAHGCYRQPTAPS